MKQTLIIIITSICTALAVSAIFFFIIRYQCGKDAYGDLLMNANILYGTLRVLDSNDSTAEEKVDFLKQNHSGRLRLYVECLKLGKKCDFSLFDEASKYQVSDEDQKMNLKNIEEYMAQRK